MVLSGETRRGLLGLALFTAYLLTAAPSVDWLDVGELVAGSWDLGVSHPPGQPLPTLLWRAAMLVPVGSIAFRATLISALCAALTALPLTLLVRRLAEPLSVGLHTPFVVGICVAALLGFASWPQAVRAEVYAPQLLLAVGVVASSVACASTDERARTRAVVFLVGLLGLSGATHPLLAIGLVPAALAGLVAAGRVAGIRALVPGAVTGLTVMGLHAYLPLRSLARPEFAWGLPHTPDALLAVLSGRSFAHNFSPSDGSMFVHNLTVVVGLLLDDLGPALILLAAAGTAILVVARQRWLASIFALAVAGNLGTVLFQNKVFASNPDLHGYLALTAVLLAATAVYAVFTGLSKLSARIGHRRAALAAYGVIGVLLCNAALVGFQVDRSQNWLAEELMRSHLDGLPPGTVVLTSGNSSAFTDLYAQRIERRRPDVARFHRTLLGHPFYELQLQTHHGAPPAGIDTAALRADARAALTAEGRVVAVEIREPDLAWSTHMRPAGRMMLLSEEPVPDALGARDPSPRWWPDTSSPTFQRDPDAVQVTLYEGLLRASYYRERGFEDLVELELERLATFASVGPADLPRPQGEGWWRER